MMLTKPQNLMILVLGVLFLSMHAETTQATDARIVRLSSNIAQGRSYQIPFVVEPEILVISKDTVVVWMVSGAHEVQVVFPEGERCERATSAAIGFKLDEASKQVCYRGLIIPNGGTASLKFNEAGVYEYEVKWGTRPQSTRARIVVY